MEVHMVPLMLEYHNKPWRTMRYWTKQGKLLWENNTLPKPQLFKHCCPVWCPTQTSWFNGLILFLNKPAPQRRLAPTYCNQTNTPKLRCYPIMPYSMCVLPGCNSSKWRTTKTIPNPCCLIFSRSFVHVHLPNLIYTLHQRLHAYIKNA